MSKELQLFIWGHRGFHFTILVSLEQATSGRAFHFYLRATWRACSCWCVKNIHDSMPLICFVLGRQQQALPLQLGKENSWERIQELFVLFFICCWRGGVRNEIFSTAFVLCNCKRLRGWQIEQVFEDSSAFVSWLFRNNITSTLPDEMNVQSSNFIPRALDGFNCRASMQIAFAISCLFRSSLTNIYRTFLW